MMFQDFDLNLLNSPDFKEDSVREEIILPLLKRLGYNASGINRIVRSKTLTQPFIYIGTKKHPVKIIPDYTLFHEEKPILILDAKSPTEDILEKAHIQQAYSYAIHPEIKCKNFALCNGFKLAVFSIEEINPLIVISIHEFDKSWNEIEKYISPKFLLNPILRKFAPDYGYKIKYMGISQKTKLYMMGVRLDLFMKVSEELFTATSNIDFCGEAHCVSFDFNPSLLLSIVKGLPNALAVQFCDALGKAPFQALAELAIEIDISCHLGEETQGSEESFIPIIIDEIIESRFNMEPMPERYDIPPSYIFQLRKAFRIVEIE